MPAQFTCSQCGSSEKHCARGLCKKCYNANHRDPVRERAYREAHKDKASVYYRAYRELHKEELAAKDRAYRESYSEELAAKRRTHKDKKAEYNRAYREQRRDEIVAKTREYHASHREQAAEKHRIYYATHRSKLIAYAKNFRKANPEKHRESVHKRRAKLRGASVAPVSIDDLYKRDKGRCGICGKHVSRNDASVDHLLPIALGGSHEPANVQLSHLTCNLRRQHRGPAQLRLLG